VLLDDADIDALLGMSELAEPEPENK